MKSIDQFNSEDFFAPGEDLGGEIILDWLLELRVYP